MSAEISVEERDGEPLPVADQMVSPTLLPYAPEVMRRADLVKVGVLPALYAAARLAWFGFLGLAGPERLQTFTTEGKAALLAGSFGGALALLWASARIATRPAAVGAATLILFVAASLFAFDLGAFLHGQGRWWLAASTFLVLTAIEAALSSSKIAAAEPNNASGRRLRLGVLPAFIGAIIALCVGLGSYFLRTPVDAPIAAIETAKAGAGEMSPSTTDPAAGAVIAIEQAPQELTDALFALAFGAPPPVSTLIGSSSYTATPAFAVGVGDRAIALVSKAEIPFEEAAHAQGGIIAVHYFGGDPNALSIVGAWPNLVETGSFGTTSDPKLRDDLLPFPVVTVEGGYSVQGCSQIATDLIVLTPAGPITTTFPSSGEFNSSAYESRLRRIDDRTLEVSYSGAKSGTLRLSFLGDRFEKTGIREDELSLC